MTDRPRADAQHAAESMAAKTGEPFPRPGPEYDGWLNEHIDSDLSDAREWLGRAGFAFRAGLVALPFVVLALHFFDIRVAATVLPLKVMLQPAASGGDQ